MNVLKHLVRGFSSKEEKHDDLSAVQPNHASDNDNSHDDSTEDRKRLWTKVSGLIGKDTTSLISLPVSLFEPITVLQSMCEPLSYAELLDKCCDQDDSIDRICFVAAFLVALFSNYVRTKKPFNPVLGETFEFVPQNKHYRSLCEQVSHHPPVGIVHTISDNWTLQQESRIETKLWGNSVDINGVGNNHLLFHKHGDHFTWKNPTSCCHNIIFGRMWIEHHGTVPLTNHTTGDTVSIHFKKAGWFEGINFDIHGEARDKDGNLKALLTGKWNESVSITKVDKNGHKSAPHEVWRKPPPTTESTNKWKWPRFVFELTALDEEMEVILPRTDSRLRPDLRALTEANMKVAGKEKNKIEERERHKKKEREVQGKKWTPTYFRKEADDKFEYRWEFVGNYWEEREQRIKEAKETLAQREDDRPGSQRDEDRHDHQHAEGSSEESAPENSA